MYIIYSGLKANVAISGLVGIVKNNPSRNFYYGSDFSGFYCDFKTGKIGLKALSGKGFYQGKVTKESLIEKGFVERVI